jgi:hypothetical protein
MMNLEQHLLRQMAFSYSTFGPGIRQASVISHIKKELIEVEKSNGDGEEWIDVIILALDGLMRHLAFSNGSKDPKLVAEAVCELLVKKQTKNEARTWSDWHTVPDGKAIEHDRSAE